MAWGSAGQVFLGEDLMHTRDYSEDTSKIIDDEVERILRAEEERAMEVLSKHRGGLNAIARALLDNEIIDGREVNRLVDEAYGEPVHTEGAKAVPQFVNGSLSNGNDGNEQPVPASRNEPASSVTPGTRPDPVSAPVAPAAVAAPGEPSARQPPEDPAAPTP